MQNGEFMRQILVEYAGRRGQKVSSQGCTEDSRDTSGAHPGEQKTSSVGTTARLTHNLGSCPLLVKRGGLEVLQRFPVHRWEGETTLLLRENSSILLASVVILMASPKVAKSRFVKRQLWQPTRVSIPQSFLTTKISPLLSESLVGLAAAAKPKPTVRVPR